MHLLLFNIILQHSYWEHYNWCLAIYGCDIQALSCYKQKSWFNGLKLVNWLVKWVKMGGVAAACSLQKVKDACSQ